MKKFLFTLVIILSITTITFAGNVNVQLNGDMLDFTDSNGNVVNAQIINSRTMVPLRKIFESLSAEIEWEDSTKTVFATKGNISIKLQINNSVAEVTKNGVVKKIILDSKPVLVEGRTLVPMRFISESLEKQVAWDPSTQTAIIIDYDYFENKLTEKSQLLGKFISKNDFQNINFSITKNYQDLLDSTNNTTSTINANSSKITNEKRKVDMNLTGNSALFNEIKNEGWNNVTINLEYRDNEVVYSSNADALNKLWETNVSTYEELILKGKPNLSMGEAFKDILGLQENRINSNTFKEIKTEYDSLLNSFSFENKNGESVIKLKNINGLIEGNYIDFANFDNMIFDEEILKLYNTINKLIFNFDVQNDVVMYEYPIINMTVSIKEENEKIYLNANIELLNNYSEKVNYIIDIIK